MIDLEAIKDMTYSIPNRKSDASEMCFVPKKYFRKLEGNFEQGNFEAFQSEVSLNIN